MSLEVKRAQAQDRLLRGRQIAFMIYEDFRVAGMHDTVLDYADLFTRTLRNDDVQEFDAKFPQMTSWKTCVNYEYVSLINSKPCCNYATLNFIR